MLWFLIFVLGACFGSFIAAFTWRYSHNISIAKGRSFCPKCKKQIVWYDNIPLFSYLVLRGKCRNCHKKISPRYFLIELFTALLFVFVGFLNYWYLLPIVLLLIAIFVIDFEHQIIPDFLIFILFIYLTTYLLIFGTPLFENLFAGFVCANIFLFLNLVTKGRGMGLGDSKLALVLGLSLGLSSSLIWLLVSFITGGIIAALLLILKKATPKTKIAFGPFLIFGYFVTMILGQQLYAIFF